MQPSPASRARARRAAVALVAVLAFALPAGALAVEAPDRTPLSTSGGAIVDRTGSPFVVQGVNWFGFETSNHLPHGLWTRDYKDMLAQIRGAGFNAIRLPFSIQALRSSTTSGLDLGGGRNAALAGKTPLEAMDVIVDEASRQGLVVLLDCHSLSDDGFMCDTWYGQGGYTEDDWVSTWQMLARRYKDRPNVIGADLKNEPHGIATWGTGGDTDWRRAAERAGSAIQAIAPNWLVVVEGIGGDVAGQQLSGHWWGGNLEGVRTAPVRLPVAHKLVYSPHEYGPGVSAQPWFSVGDLVPTLYDRWDKGFDFIARGGIAPILVGEFGGKQTDTTSVEGRWQRQFMDFLSRRGTSFTYWAWNPNSGDTGGVLQDDWRTLNPAKADLLGRLIRREAIDFPGRPAQLPAGGEVTPPPTTTTTTTTTPPPTTTTTTTTTTPPPAPASGLTAEAVLDSSWPTGSCVHLKVVNGTAQLVTGVRVRFTLPASTAITSSWNGQIARVGDTVTITPPDWGQRIVPGGWTDATGFCLAGTARPTAVTALADGVVGPPVTTTTTTTPPPVTTTTTTTTPPPVTTTTTTTPPPATTTTTTTTPPTTTTTTTTPPVGSVLTARATLDSSWSSGYCATIEVRNAGTVTATPKRVSFTLDRRVAIVSTWNGTVTRSGDAVSVALPSWVGAMAPGAVRRDFGFCADRTLGVADPLPSSAAVGA